MGEPNPDVDFKGWGNAKFTQEDWYEWAKRHYKNQHPPCKFCGYGTNGEDYHPRCIEAKKRLSQRCAVKRQHDHGGIS